MAEHPFTGAIQFAEQSSDEFQATLVRVAKDLQGRLERYAAGFDMSREGRFTLGTRNTIRLQSMREQIDEILVQSGYSIAVREFLKGYDTTLRPLVQKAWRDLGIPVGFRKADLDALRMIAGMQSEKFANIGTSGIEVLKTSLEQAVTGGDLEQNFRENLVEVLYGSDLTDRAGHGMFRHAGTLATTAVSEMNRQMDARLAEQAGIERYQYFGGIIKTTREFCRRLDGQIKTREEIDQLDNGMTGAGSAFIAGGGYNCRHIWVPIFDDSPISIQVAESYAETADVQREQLAVEEAAVVPIQGPRGTDEGSVRIWAPALLEKMGTLRDYLVSTVEQATDEDLKANVKEFIKELDSRVSQLAHFIAEDDIRAIVEREAVWDETITAAQSFSERLSGALPGTKPVEGRELTAAEQALVDQLRRLYDKLSDQSSELADAYREVDQLPEEEQDEELIDHLSGSEKETDDLINEITDEIVSVRDDKDEAAIAALPGWIDKAQLQFDVNNNYLEGAAAFMREARDREEQRGFLQEVDQEIASFIDTIMFVIARKEYYIEDPSPHLDALEGLREELLNLQSEDSESMREGRKKVEAEFDREKEFFGNLTLNTKLLLPLIAQLNELAAKYQELRNDIVNWLLMVDTRIATQEGVTRRTAGWTAQLTALLESVSRNRDNLATSVRNVEALIGSDNELERGDFELVDRLPDQLGISTQQYGNFSETLGRVVAEIDAWATEHQVDLGGLDLALMDRAKAMQAALLYARGALANAFQSAPESLREAMTDAKDRYVQVLMRMEAMERSWEDFSVSPSLGSSLLSPSGRFMMLKDQTNLILSEAATLREQFAVLSRVANVLEGLSKLYEDLRQALEDQTVQFAELTKLQALVESHPLASVLPFRRKRDELRDYSADIGQRSARMLSSLKQSRLTVGGWVAHLGEHAPEESVRFMIDQQSVLDDAKVFSGILADFVGQYQTLKDDLDRGFGDTANLRQNVSNLLAEIARWQKTYPPALAAVISGFITNPAGENNNIDRTVNEEQQIIDDITSLGARLQHILDKPEDALGLPDFTQFNETSDQFNALSGVFLVKLRTLEEFARSWKKDTVQASEVRTVEALRAEASKSHETALYARASAGLDELARPMMLDAEKIRPEILSRPRALELLYAAMGVAEDLTSLLKMLEDAIKDANQDRFIQLSLPVIGVDFTAIVVPLQEDVDALRAKKVELYRLVRHEGATFEEVNTLAQEIAQQILAVRAKGFPWERVTMAAAAQNADYMNRERLGAGKLAFDNLINRYDLLSESKDEAPTTVDFKAHGLEGLTKVNQIPGLEFLPVGYYSQQTYYLKLNELQEEWERIIGVRPITDRTRSDTQHTNRSFFVGPITPEEMRVERWERGVDFARLLMGEQVRVGGGDYGGLFAGLENQGKNQEAAQFILHTLATEGSDEAQLLLAKKFGWATDQLYENAFLPTNQALAKAEAEMGELGIQFVQPGLSGRDVTTLIVNGESVSKLSYTEIEDLRLALLDSLRTQDQVLSESQIEKLSSIAQASVGRPFDLPVSAGAAAPPQAAIAERLKEVVQDVQSKLRQTGQLAADSGIGPIIEARYQEVLSVLSSDLLDQAESNLEHLLVTIVPSGRAYASPELGYILADMRADLGTIAHEFGHQLEFSNAAIFDRITEWRGARVKGQPSRMYNIGEEVIPDRFYHEYVGKDYPDGYTEVLSMGLEAFFSPERFREALREDPEHLALIYSVIRGY